MAMDDRKLGKDGVPEDDVSSYPADAQRLQSYQDAKQALAQFKVPVLVHADNPHERLFIAAFDGTGNSKYKDPEHETNVGKVDDQVQAICHTTQICGRYVEGPGTQDGFLARTWDGMTGSSYDERLEKIYTQLITQAKDWRREDPDVQIRVADIGFSRGAEQAAGFARLLHERGIVDPDSKVIYPDEHGHMVTEYTRHIVPPGQVPQIEGLFDPVATGRPEHRDRRPPPSVIAGFAVMATDERRALFKSDHIIPPGLSDDGRFLGVMVAGAHSDIGGSYYLDGLAARSGNLMTDFLNAASDRPFLTRNPEPEDPNLNVVHRSEEGMLLYRVAPKMDRLQPDGQHLCAGPQLHADPASAACRAETRDEILSQTFNRQAVDTAVTSRSSTHDLFETLSAAAMRNDWDGMRSVERSYLASPDGQNWLMQGQQYNQQLQQQQSALEAPQRMQQQARQGPVM